MTRNQQRVSRVTAVLLPFLIAFLVWGFRTYDATNARAADLIDLRGAVHQYRALDSLRGAYEYRELINRLDRQDTAIRKICAAVTGARC